MTGLRALPPGPRRRPPLQAGAVRMGRPGEPGLQDDRAGRPPLALNAFAEPKKGTQGPAGEGIADVGPFAHFRVDAALAREIRNRLSDGDPAHPKTAAELSLRRQPLMGGVFSL